MARILILANSSVGLYGFRNELVLKLLEQHEVFISIPDTEREKELLAEGCEVIHTPINRRGMNPVEDINLFFSYKKLLKSIKPDLVLTYTIKPNIYGGVACRQKKIPYIVTITGLGSALEGKGFLQKFTSSLYRMAVKKATCIFFQNEMNRNLFEERNIRGIEQKLVSGSGVDLKHFQEVKMPNENKLRFIFVSRIMKEKGIEQYLEAAKELHCKYAHTEFWVLGACEEEYRAQLDILDKQGIIHYFGMQKDVKKYLSDVHCLVHPSFYPEGMSNVCLEAAACGRAVITTNRSGCRETVTEGVTGYLVEERNTEQLIAAMECFILLSKEEKEQMGRSGRKKMEQEFDRSKVTDMYLEKIRSVLKSV